MKNYTENRVKEVANYILATHATIRKTAKVFGVGKSTIEKDMKERLLELNPQVYEQVLVVLRLNKSLRHIRGGQTTKNRYKGVSRNANRNYHQGFIL